MLTVLSLLALSLLSSPSIQPSTASSASRSWPMYHQNAQHTGLSPFPGPAIPFLRWTFQTNGPVRSAPAVGHGRIYVSSEDGNLYALNLQGDLLWKFQTPSPIITSPAIGSDGTIYLASCLRCNYYSPSGPPEGILYAINPSGSLKWNLTIANTGEGGELSSPTIGPDGTIYTSDIGFRIIAVNPDGTLKWELAAGGEVFDSPTVGHDGTLYVGIDDDNPSPSLLCAQCMVALNPNGTVRWSLFGLFGVGPLAVGPDGTIYAGGYAINHDGTAKWRFPAGYIDSIGRDGTIYISGDSLYAINPDGTLQWQFTIGGSGGHCITTDCSVTSYVTIQQSSVAIGSNGILYFGSGVTDSTCSVSGCTRYGAGNLYAMAPNGTLSWKFAVGSTAGLYFSVSDPAIGSNGTIYVGSSDGNLYAIG